MTLSIILIAIPVAVLLLLIKRESWRIPLLMVVSALAVYALQPVLPVRGLDFWLPTLTLLLVVLAWVLTTPREARDWKANWPPALILITIPLALGFTRYLGFSLPLTASRPPQTLPLLILLGVGVLLAYLMARFTLPGKGILTAAFIFVILLFVILKVPALAALVSVGLRSLNGQATTTASTLDLRWMGFSYVAFRMLHTIRDRQTGRLPIVSLSEYVVYMLFFPAQTAGPIDRLERFIGDLRRPLTLSAANFGEAGKRLVVGLFKVFVVSDTLALVAVNGTNALQVRMAGWAWVLLYAYALQIYFNFSGYTDIAIGLGRLMGINLPENFNAPFLKPNLTLFWNSWHMTLTQWFRAYFFNPLTRALRGGKKKLPIPAIIFITQLATMLLIGLWHGVSWNFVLWGAWHGLGLFIHNRWSEVTKAWFAGLRPGWQKVLNFGGILLTFNFVALGWVFFALPTLAVSTHFLQVLFGAG
jgi:alginate O-acetyltransferase complex protein AlgI